MIHRTRHLPTPDPRRRSAGLLPQGCGGKGGGGGRGLDLPRPRHRAGRRRAEARCTAAASRFLSHIPPSVARGPLPPGDHARLREMHGLRDFSCHAPWSGSCLMWQMMSHHQRASYCAFTRSTADVQWRERGFACLTLCGQSDVKPYMVATIVTLTCSRRPCAGSRGRPAA